MTTTYAASTMPFTVETAACSDFHWMQHPSAALLWHAEQHFTEADERTVVAPSRSKATAKKATAKKATAKKATVTKAPAKRAVAKKAAARPRPR